MDGGWNMYRRSFSAVARAIKPFRAAPMLLIFMFANTMSIPVFQQLIYHIVCEETPHCNTSNTKSHGCAEEDSVAEEVRRQSSSWVLYTNIASFVPSIFVSLLLGSLSDQLGRKVFMVLPPLGMFFNCLAIIVIQLLAPRHLKLYIPGFVVAGLTGGFAAFNFTMFAYVADITPDSHGDKRTVKMSVYESMIYFGGALSGAVSGVWIKQQGFVWPYVGICVSYLAVIVYALILPIGHSNNSSIILDNREHNVQVSHQRSSTFIGILRGVLSNMIEFLKLLCHSHQLFLLILLFFVVEINFSGIYDTIVLYSLSKPLCWTSDIIGYFISLKILASGIGALVILPLLSMCPRIKDSDILVMGLISGSVSLAIMGSADTLWLMYLGEFVAFMTYILSLNIRAGLKHSINIVILYSHLMTCMIGVTTVKPLNLASIKFSVFCI